MTVQHKITSAYVMPDETEAKYGRVRYVMDMQRFAQDLAAALGGTANAPESAFDARTWATIETGEIKLHLRTMYGKGKHEHVEISSSAAHIKVPYGEVGGSTKFPSATVSTARPLDKLVADIKRRILEPAAAPLATYKQAAIDMEARRNGLASHAEALRAKFPGISVTVPPGETRNAAIYANGGGVYLNGRLYADGSVSIDRIDTLRGNKALAVLGAILS